MKVRVLCVGDLKGRALEPAAADYSKRLRRYCSLEEVALPVGKARELERRMEQEEKSLEGALAGGEVRVACDPGGELVSSPDVAAFLDEVALRHGGRVAFLIGGPDGLPAPVKARADHTWSFSRMTFPHRLFRVMLLEQIYRGFTISRGEPYHR